MALTDLIPNPNDPLSVNAPRVPSILTAQHAAPLPPMPSPGAMPDLGGNAPAPQLPVLRDLVVTNPRQQQEQALQSKISAFENPAAPKTGFWHTLGRVSARIGNIAGDILAPADMALIPGTDLNKQLQERQRVSELAGLQGQDLAERNAASENALRSAQTGEAEARADALSKPPEKTSNPWDADDKFIGPNGEPVERNRETDEYRVVQLPAGVKRYEPPQKPGADAVHPVINDAGQQVEATYSNGKWTDAQGRPILNPRPIPPAPNFASIYPQVTGDRETSNITAKWQQEAGQYQGALNTLSQAKTGSELSASLVPLGIALTTPTAAGVHRINTAEIAQAGPKIGSLARQLDAALEKAGNGAIPPDTIREAQEFVKMYQQLKYKQFLAQTKQAADTFKLKPEQTFVTSMDGQTELSLADAMKQQEQSGNGGSELPPGARAGRDAKGNIVGYMLNGKWTALNGAK